MSLTESSHNNPSGIDVSREITEQYVRLSYIKASFGLVCSGVSSLYFLVFSQEQEDKKVPTLEI